MYIYTRIITYISTSHFGGPDHYLTTSSSGDSPRKQEKNIWGPVIGKEQRTSENF